MMKIAMLGILVIMLAGAFAPLFVTGGRQQIADGQPLEVGEDYVEK